MELKDFIKQTLIDLGNGMQEAHKELTEMGGDGVSDQTPTEIKFDIALSVDQSQSHKAEVN